MPLRGVTILYLSVGSGHQVAAEAIADAMRRENSELLIRVVDPFAESIEVLPSVLEGLQAASIVLTPGLYDTLWRRGTPGSWFDRVTELGLFQDLLIDELKEYPSEVIISTHVLPCVMSVALKKQYSQIQKVYGVVTDFGLNRLWPVSGVDGYFVGHEELRNTLVYKGVAPKAIHVTGIPLRLQFEESSFRTHSTDSKRLRILFIAGGFRVGSYVEVQQYVQDLIDAFSKLDDPDKIELTVITGKQEKLKAKLDSLIAEAPFKLNVLGFVKDMHTVMINHDLMITKSGGLTISEALASGICTLLFKGGPGQESANVEFLARHGTAFRGETLQEVINVIEQCLQSPELVAEMKSRAKRLGLPSSAASVARTILNENL